MRLSKLAASFALSAPLALTAANLTWDSATGTTAAQDGAGAWTSGSTNWWNGTANVSFTSGDNLTFGAAAGNAAYAITLDQSYAVGTLTFSPTNTFPRYTLDLGGNTLTANGLITLQAQVNSYTNSFSNGTLLLNKSGSTAASPDISFDPSGGADYGHFITALVNVGSGSRFIIGASNRNEVARYSGDLRFDGGLTGSATLNFVGAAENNSHNMHFVLNSASPGFTGAVNLVRGDLALTNAAALSSANSVTFGAVASQRSAMFLFGRNVTIGSLNDTGAGTRRISNGARNVANGGTNTSGGGNSIVLGVNADSVLTVQQTVAGAFNGVIGDGPNDTAATGTASVTDYRLLGLTKTGAASLTLGGANLYTGATTINGGLLRVTGSLASGTTTAVNATASLSGSGTVNGTVNLNQGGTLVAGASGSGILTLNGALNLGASGSDTVSLNASPAGGSTILANGIVTANTSAGGVIVNIVGAAPALGQYTLLDYSGAIGGTGFAAFSLGSLPSRVVASLVDNTANSSVDLNVTAVDFPVWSGAASSAWSTGTITAPKNWVLNTNNSSTTDFLSGDSAVFTDFATGTTVDISSGDVSPVQVSFTNSTKNYTVTGSNGIAGSAGLTKAGSGNLTLSNSNSFTGTVSLAGGTVTVPSLADSGVASPLGAGTSLDLDGVTLSISGATSSSNRSLTLNSGATLSNTADQAFSGSISGTGGLTLSGPGSITLSGANSFSGNVSVNAGNLVITGGSLASPAVSLASGTSLVANSASALTLSPEIAGTGSVIKNGAGNLTLSSATSTYTGGTALNAGSVSVTNQNSLGSGALTIGTGATTGFANTTAALFVANTSAVTVPNAIVLPAPGAATIYSFNKATSGAATGTETDFSGNISGGNANLTLLLNTSTSGDNTSTFRFSGTNTFVGTVRLNRGAIIVTADDDFGDAANGLILDGNNNMTDGDLRFQAGITSGRNIGSITATNRNPISTNGFDVTLSGVLSGPAGFGKVGSGTLTFSGLNTYAGVTTVNGGVLAIGTITDGGIPSNLGAATAAADRVTFGGGTLLYSGPTASSNRAFTIGAASTAVVDVSDPASTLTLSGSVPASAGGFTKTGAGTLVLSGTNLWTGTTSVTGGVLRPSSLAAIGAGTVVDATGGTLDLNGLAFPNTTAVTVGTGGGLTGTGSLLVSGNIAGGVSPGGTGAAGQISFLNTSLALDSGAGLAFEIGGTAPGAYDTVMTNGPVTLAGTVTVTFINSFVPAAGNSFDLINDDGGVTSTATLNLPALPEGLSWNTSLFASTGVISVVSTVGGYDSFASTNGLSGPAALTDADPDGDGISNALEYAFGTNPNQSNGPEYRGVSSVASGQLVLAYRRPLGGVAGVTYGVQINTLGLAGGNTNWTNAVLNTDYTRTITPNGDGLTETVTITFSGTGFTRRFGRVSVNF